MSTQIVMAQLESTADKHVNLEKASRSITAATKEYGAKIVLFPEVFMNHFPKGTPQKTIRSESETLDGPFVTAMKQLAKDQNTWVVFGMRETTEDPNEDRTYNTTVMISSKGKIVSSYRKTHLYDAFGYKESDNIRPGDSLFEPIETPFGRIGMFVCYELRFPEIARHQVSRGADVLIVPSGWVRGPMKEYHWSTLVITRALENTVFVAACDQVSDFYCGRSLVVDPMGVAMVTGPETEALIPCTIDIDRIKEVRSKLPSFQNRRPELYGFK